MKISLYEFQGKGNGNPDIHLNFKAPCGWRRWRSGRINEKAKEVFLLLFGCMTRTSRIWSESGKLRAKHYSGVASASIETTPLNTSLALKSTRFLIC